MQKIWPNTMQEMEEDQILLYDFSINYTTNPFDFANIAPTV
jgi:hypothetical protein